MRDPVKSLLLSFGREIRAHCVGHGGPRGSEHSRQRRASHGGDWPPLRGGGGLAGKVVGKSSNTQWAFRQLWKQYGVELYQRNLSSVFMTVGDVDTLAFSVLQYHRFRVPAFDQRAFV